MTYGSDLKKISAAIMRYSNYPNDMIEKIIIFISGLEAQEKINQEQASQKQETQQQK